MSDSYLSRLIGMAVERCDDDVKPGRRYTILAAFVETSVVNGRIIVALMSNDDGALVELPLRQVFVPTGPSTPRLTDEQEQRLRRRDPDDGTLVEIVKELRAKYNISLAEAKKICDKIPANG